MPNREFTNEELRRHLIELLAIAHARRGHHLAIEAVQAIQAYTKAHGLYPFMDGNAPIAMHRPSGWNPYDDKPPPAYQGR